MSDPIHFGKWEMSNDFLSRAVTQLLDSETHDRIGYFDRPLMPPAGTRIALSGEHEGEVVRVVLDLSADGPAASVYVFVQLDDRGAFWQYRTAMQEPLAES
jgi:hypothetical protein